MTIGEIFSKLVELYPLKAYLLSPSDNPLPTDTTEKNAILEKMDDFIYSQLEQILPFIAPKARFVIASRFGCAIADYTKEDERRWRYELRTDVMVAYSGFTKPFSFEVSIIRDEHGKVSKLGRNFGKKVNADWEKLAQVVADTLLLAYSGDFA